MRTLIEKEIRLLGPAFAAALSLAIVPVWVLPFERLNPGLLFLFGVMMLALSSFGREIGLKTIPMVLAQPIKRERIWRLKMMVLGACTTLSFIAWWASAAVHRIDHSEVRMPREGLWFLVLCVAAYTAGSLWLTLLLRQIIASFWLAILIPLVMAIGIQAIGGADWMVFSAWGVYAAGGFLLARWQFIHLQEAAWTGGVITFGRRGAAGGLTNVRERGPWRALIGKELKLQEWTFVGMAGLFVLHLGVVALRKAGAHVFSPNTLSALEMFGMVWVIVPFLAGGQSVAEERQFATLDGLLCQPISRRGQFALKFIVVLVLGGVLSAALACAAEWIGRAVVVGAQWDFMGGNFKFVPTCCAFLALSLLGFWASTLTRSVLQALVAGVISTFVFWWVLQADFEWLPLWWQLAVIPALAIAILWLAYGNFRWLFESRRRWSVNALTLSAVLVVTAGLVESVYNRVWELAMPMEPVHEPARLPKGKPPMIRGYGGTGLAIVLPDGRLWTDRLGYENGWLSLGGDQFVPGSNWVAALADSRDTVAIRSDGTLWVSERPRQPWLRDRHPAPEASPPMVQFGRDTNWQSLARDPVLLLKRDGTLWSWGTNEVDSKHYYGLRSFTARQVGTSSDWARIERGGHWTYGWKRDETAYVLLQRDWSEDWLNFRLPSLDHLQFRNLNSYPSVPDTEVGVRDDGTLWRWSWQNSSERWSATLPTNQVTVVRNWYWLNLLGREAAPPVKLMTDVAQVGKDSDWAAVQSGVYQVVALKTDGSLWRWDLLGHSRWVNVDALQEAPARLGTHSDWIGLCCWLGQPVALSADGTLWCLPRITSPRSWEDEESRSWLGPSRKLVEIENIFAHE